MTTSTTSTGRPAPSTTGSGPAGPVYHHRHPAPAARRPGPVHVADTIGLARLMHRGGRPRHVIADVCHVTISQVDQLLAGYDPWRPRPTGDRR